MNAAQVDPVSLYLNFVLNAVGGKMGEADAIMRAGRGTIAHVAGALAKFAPFEPKPLYRGMLLDPSKPFVLDARLTFMSWSEDRAVAEWFACRESVISEPLVEAKPELRGFLATLAEPTRVLWHHSWVDQFGGIDGFADLALRHPLMGAYGRREIAWSLATQSEVITAPLPITPSPVDIARSYEIDRRLSPPWFEVTP